MKTTNLFTLAAVVLLSSCTTAYRTGQTPDDVYFSPARPEEEYVKVQREDSRRYRYVEESYEDRFLRMRVHNRYQWGDLNDWYAYERSTLGYNTYFAPSLNPYVAWNYYYNPYYSSYHYHSPLMGHWAMNQGTVKTISSGPRQFNMSTYQQLPINLKTVKAQSSQYAPGNYGAPAGRSASSNRGNTLREIFSNSGGSYTSPGTGSGNSSPSPTQSSSGSSSGSAGSSAPVRRF